MTRRPRILITGSSGFLGRAMSRALADCGDVTGVDRVAAPGTVAADLCDVVAARTALEAVGPVDVVVHLAALAHGERPPGSDTTHAINVGMTRSLLDALGPARPHFIFFSSVAVYGEDDRPGPIAVTAPVRPATEYGVSKYDCERLLQASPLPDIDVLRLAPVFARRGDHARLDDVRKRVFLPGLPVKMRMYPAPWYSLCQVETVARVVRTLVERGPAGRHVQNVADEPPYSQHTLADWFPGPVLPLPTALTAPAYWLTRCLPEPLGYRVRCLYTKLFGSNIYDVTAGGFFD
jgi:nucleoside-diphosphate-sugar epimerase